MACCSKHSLLLTWWYAHQLMLDQSVLTDHRNWQRDAAKAAWTLHESFQGGSKNDEVEVQSLFDQMISPSAYLELSK